MPKTLAQVADITPDLSFADLVAAYRVISASTLAAEAPDFRCFGLTPAQASDAEAVLEAARSR